jgi:hypothetical protein
MEVRMKVTSVSSTTSGVVSYLVAFVLTAVLPHTPSCSGALRDRRRLLALLTKSINE